MLRARVAKSSIVWKLVQGAYALELKPWCFMFHDVP